MATYVLVPGGWHGGWYFQNFAEALRARGHRAYAVTLTGLGERRHLLRANVNLDTHVEDVVRLLEMENLSEVILLGHSYAGMVVSGALDLAPSRIAAAIYADAYVPEDGQSCFGLSNDFHRKVFLDNAAKDGFSVLPPSRLADPRVTPHPLATFLQSVRLKNPPPPVKRGFVYLSGWPETPFTSTFERLRAVPEWQTFDLPVGHNVIAAAFDELLEIALQFA
ncbi:MAG: alpha/beta fold hydrolase [Pseudolabrys sp.]|jgi:pimeloyl-ACP methyl ester carboxylesterase